MWWKYFWNRIWFVSLKPLHRTKYFNTWENEQYLMKLLRYKNWNAISKRLSTHWKRKCSILHIPFLFGFEMPRLLNTPKKFGLITYLSKVQLFWEGHKNLLNLPHGFDIYLVNVKTMRKITQIFVAFSEKVNFKYEIKDFHNF